MTPWLLQVLARLPASVHAKLLMAFLGLAGLRVTVGAVGLGAKKLGSESHNRAAPSRDAGHGEAKWESVPSRAPNKGMQATAYSVRCAPAARRA